MLIDGTVKTNWEMEQVAHAIYTNVHREDERLKMKADETIRKYVEQFIKPEIAIHGISCKKNTDCINLLGKNVVHEVYALAPEFGMNAKITSNPTECIYSFWYGTED